jgi:hypothetical protein
VAAGAADKAHGPMDQFEIVRLANLELFGLDISFTNSSLLMVLAVMLICWFMTLNGWLQIALMLALTIATARPLGLSMAAVLETRRTFLDPLIGAPLPRGRGALFFCSGITAQACA